MSRRPRYRVDGEDVYLMCRIRRRPGSSEPDAVHASVQQIKLWHSPRGDRAGSTKAPKPFVCLRIFASPVSRATPPIDRVAPPPPLLRLVSLRLAPRGR